MKRKPARKKSTPEKLPSAGEIEGVFSTDREYLERQGEIIRGPDFPLPQIDHQGFGTEVSILTSLQEILFDSLEELEFSQVISEDDPRRSGWQPILGEDAKSELAWELIRRVIDLEVTPFGRGMFARGVLWAADKTSVEVQAAAAMIRAQRENSHKGGKARSRQAEPKRQLARRLDRELRKTVKKKYVRVQRIAAEMRCSEKTIERYLSK